VSSGPHIVAVAAGDGNLHSHWQVDRCRDRHAATENVKRGSGSRKD